MNPHLLWYISGLVGGLGAGLTVGQLGRRVLTRLTHLERAVNRLANEAEKNKPDWNPFGEQARELSPSGYHWTTPHPEYAGARVETRTVDRVSRYPASVPPVTPPWTVTPVTAQKLHQVTVEAPPGTQVTETLFSLDSTNGNAAVDVFSGLGTAVAKPLTETDVTTPGKKAGGGT